MAGYGIQWRPPVDRLDCSKFRVGRFILISDNPVMKGEIIRKGDTQIIKDLFKNSETLETIKWLSDCKYKIEEKEKPESRWLTVEIIKIVGDTAYLQGSYPNIDNKPVLKIFKVK